RFVYGAAMRNALFVSSLALFAACSSEPPQPALPTAGTAQTTAMVTAAPPVSATAAAPAARVIKRVVVSLSRKSGTQLTTINPDATMSVPLDVLLNGRGPHVDAKLSLAADGTIASYEAKGHRTMGTKIDESFAKEGAHARWKSVEEQGEKD